MEDLADLCSALGELGAGGFDVVDDEVDAAQGSGRAEVSPTPNWTEAPEPGGVSCTMRKFSSATKSASSRQPSAL